ncbi:MAG: trypsin-like peptidase domain-containing protein [Candidatus Methylomirabilis sp.]|nr:trypsin-like peptidase domain-containing protein [Deltaproteobacteria bacterium]
MVAGGLFLPLSPSKAIDWPFGGKEKAAEQAPATRPEAVEAPPVGAPPSFAALAKSLSPCVVNIATTKEIKARTRVRRFPGGPSGPGGESFEDFFEQFNRFFGEQAPHAFRQNALGTGFIISKDGYIITNNHVVDGADDIKVVLNDKQEYPAKLIGTDPKTDVALIKIEANGDLPVAVLGESADLEIGEWVVAIGNPFGLGHTVTAGIISAKGRVIGAGPYDDFIQTDASINPGNSGGPLFNLRGEVVGINTAIIQNAQGIGFATPIDLAKNVVEQLKDNGKVVRGWLGVAIQDIDPDTKQFFGVDEAEGALVTQVMDDSPAAKAGIERDDVIVKFDGRKISGAHGPGGLSAGPRGKRARRGDDGLVRRRAPGRGPFRPAGLGALSAPGAAAVSPAAS